MKHRLPLIKCVPLTLASAGAAIVVSLLPTSSARAGIEPTPFMTGLVGIARGDVARLNAVNLHPPDPVRGARACEVVLTFLDSRGEQLVDDAGSIVMQKVALAPDQATSLDLSWRWTNFAADASGLRSQVRAHVVLGSRDGRRDPCAETAATLEIYDEATGRTSVLVHPGSLVGFNPQPEPPKAK